MFEMVSGIGHIEAFLATKNMKVGALFYFMLENRFPQLEVECTHMGSLSNHLLFISVTKKNSAMETLLLW